MPVSINNLSPLPMPKRYQLGAFVSALGAFVPICKTASLAFGIMQQVLMLYACWGSCCPTSFERFKAKRCLEQSS